MFAHGVCVFIDLSVTLPLNVIRTKCGLQCSKVYIDSWEYLYIIYNMKRPMRQSDGLYHIHGKTFKMLIGSRQQVWNKTAFKTEGLLTRDQLIMNKWGRIVSKKKHATAKKEKRLQKYGFFTRKGKFGFVKKTRKNIQH